MSDRRPKVEPGEDTKDETSKAPRGPSDPLHSSAPQLSYYPRQPPQLRYPSSAREGISAYASHRSRAALPMASRRPMPAYGHGGHPMDARHGGPPVDPRSAAQQVTPDSRQPPMPTEFMSPPSSLRRRYPQSPAASSAKSSSSSKRPRRSGTFVAPDRVQVFVSLLN